jgi:hypothetical protein
MNIKKLYLWITLVTFFALVAFFGISNFIKNKEIAIPATITFAVIFSLISVIMLILADLDKRSFAILVALMIASITVVSTEVIIEPIYYMLIPIVGIAIAVVGITAYVLHEQCDKKYVYCGYAMESIVILIVILF